MFREELRLHHSFIGSIGSGFFPVMIFVFSVVLAVAFPRFQGLKLPTVLLLLHLGAVLYGLSVGALGRIGEEAMTRRMGQVSMILRLPQTQPLSFRRAMGIFFAKDAVFYIFYAIVPIIGGIAVAAPLAGAPLTSVALLGLTLFLAFLIGMSLSFLASVLSTRSTPLAVAALSIALALVLLVWPLEALPPGNVLLPLGFWAHKDPTYLLASALVAVLLSAAAVRFTKERYEAPTRSFPSALLPTEARFAFTDPRRTLVAKEWLEIRRSGALGAVVGGFLGPLVAVYLIAWIFRAGIGVPIEFNVVFYGVMVGFLGVMVYSWLTNIEPNEFLDVQPVTLDAVITAKLWLYFLLTAVVSVGYVIAIGVLQGQAGLVPVSLLLAAATTAYVAGVTARLTGIWTNTMLFDARVLGKFAGAVIPPLILAAILSFLIVAEPVVATVLLVAESAALLAAARLLARGIKSRWGGTRFAIPSLSPSSPPGTGAS